ncbi:hypothetical protein GALL_442320 [mine drainage metagenome]|uniref:Uncharacterized protein n=1 Tax=mine drainage metagenome TaxID=410659 RepID=A0A1J5Q2A6_9ZZZZ
MRGNRRGQSFVRRPDIGHTFLRRHMLHHHAQPRRLAPYPVEHAVDEHCLSVENIDGRISHLAMHAQRQANVGHRLQHRAHLVKVAHTRVGVGGGPGGIQLYRSGQPGPGGGHDILWVGVLGQVERHQRRERRPLRHRPQDAVAVIGGLSRGHHRRHKVRHHDGAREMARRLGQDTFEHGTIAQVQVPVVGAAEGEALGHALRLHKMEGDFQWVHRFSCCPFHKQPRPPLGQ